MSSGLMGGEKTRGLFNKNDGIGVWKGGIVVEPFPYKAQQTDYDTGEPLWWDKEETQPKEHIIVTLQTELNDGPDEDGFEDTGRRRVYLKGGDLQRKTQLAVRAAGGDDFEIGAKYFACRTGYGTPRQNAQGRDLNPPWTHEVEYARPAKTSGLNDGGGSGGNMPKGGDGSSGGNLRKGGETGGNTVLDRSQARQAAAKAPNPPSPLSGQKPAVDDEPPF